MNSLFYLLFCYRKANSRVFANMSTNQYCDTRVTQTNIFAKNLTKIDCFCQSKLPWKRFRNLIHYYGVKRALPLALRALITFWPPLVCIRARNPCVLARFKLLG